MIKKRINTDLFIRLYLLMPDGQPADLTGAYDMSVLLRHNSYSRANSKQDFTIEGNVISFQLSSLENINVGKFSVSVAWNKEDASSEIGYRRYEIDFRDAFEIVHWSDEEDPASTEFTGTLSQNRDGINGLSAFEIWKVETGQADATIEDYFKFLQAPAVEAKDTIEGALDSLAFRYESGKLYLNKEFTWNNLSEKSE